MADLVDKHCLVWLSGARYAGFDISRGIRQGCPLSPLLFAMATDLLLRRLHRHFPLALSRAWADDIAMVLPSASAQLRLLQDFFLDFGRVAGLHLNISKTVLVPLFNFSEEVIRNTVSLNAPDWGGVSISDSAKYLGFFVGPGKGTISWKGPLQKYRERAKQWGKLGLGMLLTMQAYRVYISSVLQFVAQLEPLPPEFAEAERHAIQSLCPGPTAWTVPTLLKDAAYLHLPVALADMAAISSAAKVRVAHLENIQHGGLKVHSRYSVLLQSFGTECSLGHVARCTDWGQHSFLAHLVEADIQFGHKLQAAHPYNILIHKREDFQRNITPLFRSIPMGASMIHIRRRMDRWSDMLTLPGHRPERARRVLGVLRDRATPRIQAAYLRSICNGWCTRHRFQMAGGCLFGCGYGPDKLEHYARCSVVDGWFTSGPNSVLNSCRPDAQALDRFFCMLHLHEEVIVAQAARLYALHRLHCGIRHRQFVPREYFGAFKRFVSEGLR